MIPPPLADIIQLAIERVTFTLPPMVGKPEPQDGISGLFPHLGGPDAILSLFLLATLL